MGPADSVAAGIAKTILSFGGSIVLSLKSRPYINASVPVLREHGLTITRTFYRNMFAAHPELTNLFNMGNQANGSQQQSLASAVFAYAANYENADPKLPPLNIAAKPVANVTLRTVLSNSFGFGGTNACLVLRAVE